MRRESSCWVFLLAEAPPSLSRRDGRTDGRDTVVQAPAAAGHGPCLLFEREQGPVEEGI